MQNKHVMHFSTQILPLACPETSVACNVLRLRFSFIYMKRFSKCVQMSIRRTSFYVQTCKTEKAIFILNEED